MTVDFGVIIGVATTIVALSQKIKEMFKMPKSGLLHLLPIGLSLIMAPLVTTPFSIQQMIFNAVIYSSVSMLMYDKLVKLADKQLG